MAKESRWRKPKEIETQPKPSIRMARYIKACRMFDKYSILEERAAKNKRKWLRQVKYYQKVFNQN